MTLAYFGGVTFGDSAGFSLSALVLAAVVLDLGVIADQTLERRAINPLRPEAHGRINGLFTGLFFLGAAVGSALSGFAWSVGVWPAICAVGTVFGVGALGVSLTGSGEWA